MKVRRLGLGVSAIVITVVAVGFPVAGWTAGSAQVFAQAGAANAPPTVPQAAVTAEARGQAAEIFTARCATCHGDQGRGNGPAAANLKPPPINFHSRKWQRSVSDQRIAQAIVYGGKAVGLSSEMASNPDLENEPAVVAALVEHIRKWAK
jgi:mono/diheme cytochrome c family protein